VFQRDEDGDLASLKEVLKVVMYMNRLLLDGENLILGRRKTLVVDSSNALTGSAP
jgi:hypothetical protein